MVLGQTLHKPGGKLRYVFFPTTAIGSLLYVIPLHTPWAPRARAATYGY